MKPIYDRHRRIKKRYTFGGYCMGEELPKIERTWGQIFIAKRKGKMIAAFFSDNP